MPISVNKTVMRVGSVVEIVGLTARPEFNGRSAVVRSLEDTGRFKCALVDGSKVLLCKSENIKLVPVAAPKPVQQGPNKRACSGKGPMPAESPATPVDTPPTPEEMKEEEEVTPSLMQTMETRPPAAPGDMEAVESSVGPDARWTEQEQLLATKMEEKLKMQQETNEMTKVASDDVLGC